MAKPIIFLQTHPRVERYTNAGKPITEEIPERNRYEHAAALLEQYESSIASARTEDRSTKDPSDGFYVDFSSSKDEDLEFSSLESTRSGIRLLNVREQDGITEATIFIPKGKESILSKKIRKYADPTKDNKKGPANNALCASVNSVKPATAKSLWTGRAEKYPQKEKQWVEIWIRTSNEANSIEEAFRKLADELSIPVQSNSICFPERTVLLAYADKTDLNRLFESSTYLAEIREASAAASFFNELPAQEANEWIDDLLKRVKFTSGKSVVCVLDSGVNIEQPLLKHSIKANAAQTALENTGADDLMGHGTSVAGIVLYDDLKEKLISYDNYDISHRFESVKIYQENYAGSNMEEQSYRLYGDITAQAISRAEIANQESNRIICTAVTADSDERTDGKPTSWSGAVDEIIANPDESDSKLFLVSAGNIRPQEYEGDYPTWNQLQGVKSPGQSWNALTVGAFSELDMIQRKDYIDQDYEATAIKGQLSPFSTTSLTWDRTWPIKPEIVCAGGNTARKGSEQLTCPDLSRISTGHHFLTDPFSTINATSAAVAQAAWIASEIENAYPRAWPETIRGLIVHSARWTSQMREQFCPDDSTKAKRSQLVRACGYGVPDAQRAIECANNSVNLVIQGELQPFCYENSRDKTNEMHFHKIPWPKEILSDLGNKDATLRVTLSYFIEPSPGEIGWKQKYTYQSHGLRFDVNKAGETFDEFARRITKSVQDEETKQSLSGSGNWYLGDTIRNVGSIHSDWKCSSGIELSDTEYIAVYPVNGWWRKRRFLNKIDSVARYALIVSIETPETDIDLYTEIQNIIEIENKAPIEIFV